MVGYLFRASLIWNVIGAALIGALLLAPIYYAYLLFRKSPKLTKNIDDYSLADFEQGMLDTAMREAPELARTHQKNLEKGLRLTKSGQFDKRSNNGKDAALTKARLDEKLEAVEYLTHLPLERLSSALAGRKVKISAGASLISVLISFLVLKTVIATPDASSSLFGTYLMSTAISIGFFAGSWILASVWYFFSFRTVKLQLIARMLG
ncbi:MAG: hypothetical protein AB1450_03575 [Pseudomonadota bacterium]